MYMSLYRTDVISVEEYFQIRESSEELLEYIDGYVYMPPTLTIKHQRISGRLFLCLGKFLEGSSCEVFHAPMDVELSSEEIKGTKIVIPDLTVICDKEGFTAQRYVGIPSVIIEILSPSNQSHDLITKLNLYMDYGVQEYWIVNPMLNSVMVYTLNDKGMYEQHDLKIDKGTISSKVLQGFRVNLEEIFQD